MTVDEAKHALFDPVTYKTLFLAYLTANNLPFTHSDSPALATLLAYVTNCELDELPIVYRHSMRTALNIVYRDSVNDIKDKPANHKGEFDLTLDEWKSGNNFDVLPVTLHYHDSDFKMRKYPIGFEVLSKDVFHTGEVLYKHLDNVLTYNIKHRIISITRDNTSPIISFVTKFKASLVNEEDIEEFSEDLSRFGHVMNLATTNFLSPVHFKTTKSKAFSDTLKAQKEMSPHLKDTFDLMETMPHIMDTNVGGTRHKNYVGNLFNSLSKIEITRSSIKEFQKI